MSFSLQWTRDGVDISGATGNSYLVVDADLGTDLAFRVVASNVAGSTTATSVPLPIPASGSPPVISGTPPADALIGTPYAGFTPSVIGGTLPYTFSLHTGTLPGGLSLNTSTGSITGTTTTNETQTGLVIRVTDAHSRFADLAAFSITSALGVTPATYVAAIASHLVGGGTLLMQPGDYGTISLAGKVANGITLLGQAGVHCASITTTTSSGFTFDLIEVTDKNSSGYGATIGTGSSNVEVTRCVVGTSVANGSGLQARSASNVRFTHNTVMNKGQAITGLLTDGLVITHNTIIGMVTDGIFGNGCTNVTVEYNTATPSSTSGHPDFIQFDSSGTTRSAGLVIRYNNFDRQSGGPAQGYFLSRCDNVTIDSNAAFGSMANGVAVSQCTNVAALNTFVQGWDYAAGFIVRGASDTVNFTGNFAASFSNYAGNGANTNVTPIPLLSGNHVQGQASGPTDRTAYLAFLAAHNIPTA